MGEEDHSEVDVEKETEAPNSKLILSISLELFVYHFIGSNKLRSIRFAGGVNCGGETKTLD